MKTTLLFFVLIISTIVWCNPVDVRLTLIDAIIKTPVEGIQVFILSDEGEALGEGKSDEKGKVEISIEMPRKAYIIIVKMTDKSELYGSKEVLLYKGKGPVISSELNISPSVKMYKLWYAKDDSIYGGDKDGVLAPSLNTSELICGCELLNLSPTEFPGGNEEMTKYIQRELRYPQESIEMNEQGKVYMKFIVEADGKLTHLLIERGTSPTLDAEAYRVIRSMPNWKPAECDGKKIRSVARLPFTFTLH